MININLFLVLWLFLLFTLPGTALLILSRSWYLRSVWQSILLAVGLSISLYPVGFYALNLWLPQTIISQPVLYGVLGASLLIVVIPIAKSLVNLDLAHLRPSIVTVAALIVFLLTIGSRMWFIADHPYPAWTDSLHHTLITQFVAERGQLTYSLEPYFPIPLDMYHLGLYTLSGSAMMLAEVPAHTALLWTAQLLNGLCGIGVFFALDRLLPQHQHARLAALVGAAVVGLFSHHPALYANWGRFTQISSQVILLIAWVVVWETLDLWSEWWSQRQNRDTHEATEQASNRGSRSTSTLIWHTLFSALLSAAVFLLHFRVAAFYILLLSISVLIKLWQGWQQRRLFGLIIGIACIGIVSILLVLPPLVPALQSYIKMNTEPIEAFTAEEVSSTIDAAYAFPFSTIPYLVARPWLLICAGVMALVGLWRRNTIVIISLVWAASLIALGSAYLLGISLLNVTNLGTVFIMLYLPIGLIIGAGIYEIMTLLPESTRKAASATIAVLLIIFGAYAATIRATQTEPHRFFISEQDIAAMDWIRENTEPTARFAVNTYFWLPIVAHGADAGYWIPYFTQRDTTASAMPILAADWDYQLKVLEESRAVETLSTLPDVDKKSVDDALDTLRKNEIEYLYIGAKGHFEGGGLNVEQLSQHPEISLRYENRGAAVLKIED